jgi:hypothetical protein
VSTKPLLLTTNQTRGWTWKTAEATGAQDRSFSGAATGRLVLLLVTTVLVLAPYIWRLSYLRYRIFDQDEFEHLHAAWCVFKGLVPYRDFFEMHMPWLYFTVAPLFHSFAVDSNVTSAINFIFFARQISWVLTGLILVGTIYIGAMWRDLVTGLVAALFLTNTELFLTTTLEFRPDVPSTLCSIISLALLLHGFKTEERARSKWYFFISGILTGAAVMFTQKLVFMLPGIGLALAWYIAAGFPERSLRRLAVTTWLAVGFLVPIAITLAYFFVHGALGAFFYYNFFFAATFGERFGPLKYMGPMIYNSPYLALFAALGLATFVAGLCLTRDRRTLPAPVDVVIYSALFSLLAGLFIIPVPYSQYLLAFLPLASLVAARALLSGIARLAEFRTTATNGTWTLVTLSIATLILLTLLRTHPPVIALYWFAALSGCLALTWWRIPTLATVFFVMAVSVAPMSRLHSWSESAFSNAAQLDAVRYVLANTTADDTVMDGFSGSGVFRPHAYFYYMVHQGVRVSVGDDARTTLLAGLESGRIAPRLVIFDHYLRAFSPPVTAYIERHYEPVGTAEIWRRRQVLASKQ